MGSSSSSISSKESVEETEESSEVVPSSELESFILERYRSEGMKEWVLYEAVKLVSVVIS